MNDNRPDSRNLAPDQCYPVVNPYTFIPLEKSPDRSDVRETYADPEKLLSGWLEVRITPKTDLMIPDGKPMDGKGEDALPVNEDDNQTHRYLHFYRNPDGTPAIPGSSLRGMIRSVYEAASNSCLPQLLEDGNVSTRTPVYASFTDRGLLGKTPEGKWAIFPVRIYRKQLDWQDRNNAFAGGLWKGNRVGSTVRFSVDGEEVNLDVHGPLSGILQFQMPIDINKYSVSILEETGQKPITIKADAYDRLCYAVDHSVQNDSKGSAAQQIHSEYRELLKKAGTDPSIRVPVWYILVGTEYYLSISSIGRVGQKSKWENIAGAYAPCDGTGGLCPACSLFGTAGGKGMKGRVRFTDALPLRPDAVRESLYWRTIPFLGGAKPTAFEFYLRRPANATYWNYDYYVTGKQSSATYHSYRKEWSVLRGRKMYWHRKPEDTQAYQNERLNVTLETLRAGNDTDFSFRLFFDRITAPQLRQLRWILTFGENRTEGATLCHKLGHARPLGYGSVKLVVEREVVRNVEAAETGACYRLTEHDIPKKQDCPFKDGETVRSILKMADLQSAGDLPVAYPRRKKSGETEIFEWFSNNRANRGDGPREVLPGPLEEDISVHSNVDAAEYSVSAQNERWKRENPDEKPVQEPEPAREDADQMAPGKTVSVRIQSFDGDKGKMAICRLTNGDEGRLSVKGKSLTKDYGYAVGDAVLVRLVEWREAYANWKLELLDQ